MSEQSSLQDRKPKPYTLILQQEIEQGLIEIRRPAGGLLASGLSAGLDIGFSLLLMAIVFTLAAGEAPTIVVELLLANMYSVGFILVVLGRSELFTEHTTLAVFPFLAGRASIGRLLRLWSLVYTSNLAGAALFAALAAVVGPAVGVIEPNSFVMLARNLTEHSWWVILMSATLAGWLMGLLSWLVAAADDTMGRVTLVWIVTAAIGLAHLHHSIAGTVEVLAGVFSGEGLSLADYGRFLFWATLGNAIGGVVFVALIKYGHVIQSSREVTDVIRLGDPPRDV